MGQGAAVSTRSGRVAQQALAPRRPTSDSPFWCSCSSQGSIRRQKSGWSRMSRMEERSEEQVISRLFDLENNGLAAQRAELTGERFLSRIQDPDNGLRHAFQHDLDQSAGP